MIYLGIGSNLSSKFGDRFQNINTAIDYLGKFNIKVEKKSSFYETPSYPDKSKPKFINVIIKINFSMDSSDLASAIINTEEYLERKRKKKNDPRTCDIDIIDYRSRVFNFKYRNFEFKIPHQNLVFRNFVLFPLREIAPNWIHPKTKEHIDSLILKLSNLDKNSILKVKKY